MSGQYHTKEQLRAMPYEEAIQIIMREDNLCYESAKDLYGDVVLDGDVRMMDRFGNSVPYNQAEYDALRKMQKSRHKHRLRPLKAAV